ncbi:MAG: transcriptional regulator, partial [Betaproteobacteria bacterium]|nr:transcriptional regulator [Betaproteobacteria bacterium]
MASDVNGVDWRSECPISSALDVLGDKWSMLIIRDLLIHGPRTYSELLASPEHIATNILASRLNLLTCLKLIERTNPEATARNNA